ncbi:MAG: hypothetical protein DMG68_17525 [Acidobacteria bacterium]|jgi:hypothetical protein|nr:MAG: hypothetical protein DMG68_17525 [Acidobacteriota bacterium]
MFRFISDFRVYLALLALSFAFAVPAGAKDRRTGPPVLRWQEGAPECECTLEKTKDGFFRYSLGYETLHVSLSIDNQELEKTRRTAGHVFGVILTIRNRGTIPVKLYPGYMTLELEQHFRVRLRSEDPDSFAYRLQDDSDELVHQSERELKKHPERKQAIEDRLKEHEKFVTEWLQFVSTQSLRDVTLDTGQPEVTGWIFFDTKTKWKGSWKKQEDFILRVPTDNVIFEIPFTLPPLGEEPELRQRSQE